jgi:hypothetical protein
MISPSLILGNRGARSRYRGVSFDRRTRRWQAQVTIDGQAYWLGRHDTEEDAFDAVRAFRIDHEFLMSENNDRSMK